MGPAATKQRHCRRSQDVEWKRERNNIMKPKKTRRMGYLRYDIWIGLNDSLLQIRCDRLKYSVEPLGCYISGAGHFPRQVCSLDLTAVRIIEEIL